MNSLPARRQFILILSAVFLLGLTTRPLPAQTFDATALRVPHDLDARWLVHAGDDPAYAQPNFNDSQWTLFDPTTSLRTIFANTEPPVIWYRLRVKVDPAQTGLALREWNTARAFEIYVNGERLIASGRVAPFVPYTFQARLVRRIPEHLVANGSLLIAFRVHISPAEWGDQFPGFYPPNLTLGQYETLDRDGWLQIIGENALSWMDRLLLIAIGLVAFVLFAAQRRQPEYLWIAALGGLTFLQFPTFFVTLFHNIPSSWQIVAALPRIASPFVWASLYFAFVHQRMGWRWKIFLLLAGVMNAYSGLQGLVFPLIPFAELTANLPFVILLAVIVPIVLAIHLRRGNREAGILLIPAVFFSLYIYAEFVLVTLFRIPATQQMALHWLNLIDRYPVGPFAISLNHVSSILSTLALAIIMLLRSTTMIRRQTILEGELAAAQQVQQLLVPEQATAVSGFTVESVYEPAQQVGGDFFQIVPTHAGGLLVVVGDVAGKGLPAAMLVSVLVGAIRGVSQYTSDPSELLTNLNERLVGHANGGFATALAANIDIHGAVTIANAGHLSPYLDGEEIDLQGALPLGIQSGTRYESRQFHLPPGSRLTFYSDGVIEAQNLGGELFGFERGCKISVQPAAAIVAAAVKFGQQDDITVVSV